RVAPARVGADVVAHDGGPGLSSSRRTEGDAAVRVAADDVARSRTRATDGVLGGRIGGVMRDNADPVRIAPAGTAIGGDPHVGAAHRATTSIGQGNATPIEAGDREPSH